MPSGQKPAKVKITSNKKPLGGKHENLLKKNKKAKKVMRGSIMRDSIPWGKLENPNAGKKELKKPKKPGASIL